MSDLDRETELTPVEPGRWRTTVSDAWDIGDTANGGYASAAVLRAMRPVDHPDPLSVTTHFLRPVRGAGPAEVTARTVRSGRTTTTTRGTLRRDDRILLTGVAVFGDLDAPAGASPTELSPPPPHLPAPDACVSRAELAQGVALPILDRLDIRVHPELAEAGSADAAVMAGWIRFADGTDPTTEALPLFADAFPPSLFSLLGRVGWVPTIELTVHVRRRPASGWIAARFECDDLVGGRMIESGTLWDATGAVVARSRQLGVLLTDGD